MSQLTTETDEPALPELVKNPPETAHVLTTSEDHSTEISLYQIYQLPTIQQSSLSVSSNCVCLAIRQQSQERSDEGN